MADKEEVRQCFDGQGNANKNAYKDRELTPVIEIVFNEPIDTETLTTLIAHNFPGIKFVTKVYENSEENRKKAKEFVEYYMSVK